MNAILRLPLASASVLTLGLLSGLLLGTGLQNSSYRTLAEPGWVQQHQAQDALFSRVMPPFFMAAVLLTLGATIVAAPRARGLLAAATLLGIVCIVFTVRTEVPLNRLIASWTPGAAPADWATVRQRWLSNHLVRTIAAIVAFFCAVAGLALE